jgi:hypothetical protein
MSAEKATEFERELSSLINRYSLENGSNTPDYILASYLRRCLYNYNTTVTERDKWHGMSDRCFVPTKEQVSP